MKHPNSAAKVLSSLRRRARPPQASSREVLYGPEAGMAR